jgi:signal transduction histidine kinase
MKSLISTDATITGMKLNFRSHLMKWGIIFSLTILYALSSLFLMPIFGPVTISLSGFPVAAAGWYFGLAGGIIASLVAIILNNFLMSILGGLPWYTVDRSGFFMSASILIMVGVGCGQIKKYYDSQLRAKIQLISRERFLALLNNMTRSIIAEQSLDVIMQTFVNDLTILLEADSCYITRWDPVKEQVFPVAANVNSDHPFLKMEYPKGGKNLTTSALEAGHILIVENTSDTTYTTPHIIQKFSEKSFISIPLMYGENKLGAAVVGFNESHQFTAEKLEHAKQASNQIALAVWTVQQDFELKKHLQEVETLVRISRALSETEKIGLQNVLQLIVTSAKELIPGAEQAVIHLLDKEEQLLEAQAVSGYEDTATNWKLIKIRPNEGIAGQVLVSGQTINIADVEKDSRFVTYAEPPKYRSLIVAPVQSGEHKLGTISVQSVSVSAFTEAESRLLSALGTQAATAIENAHLLESIQEALKESNALYRINQGLVASLDPQELLKDVVNLLQKNFGYYHVQIYVLEPETGDFVMREGSGEIGRQLKEQEYSLHAGEGIVGYTAETGAPFFTNDVDKVHFFVRNQLLSNTKSELSVPVKISGHVLGVLDVQQIPPALLTQRDLQLVNAVAGQLAIALQKANLYSDLQAALQVETAIRNQMVQSERLVTMGRLLASVSHELNNPLQAIQNALFLLREEKGISLQGRLDLDIVLSEAERMSTLIERLRSTYRPIQAEDFQPTQVNDIIEDVYALISTHLRHNEIAFEFHPEPDLPLIPALADQIRQVIINLLMNAVQAMTTGGNLMVCTSSLQDSNEILLTVSDTGTGIPPELLPNIFDAFVTNKQTGTGLGLTISYDIVIKHHGRITAENNPDKGSIFKIWLPTLTSEIK